MLVVTDYPPNYKELITVFPIKDKKGILFCYSPTIYNPDNIVISEALMAHEETHSKQQKNNPESWWKQYIENAEFRLREELKAHIVELKIFSKRFKDRNVQSNYLRSIAIRLSSSMYGNSIRFPEALKLLRQA